MDAYTLSNPVCDQNKSLEFKSSCRFDWTYPIKYYLFHKRNDFRTATKLVEPPYETEWDFFIKSLLNGKTDALIEVLLLIIIITLDLAVIFYYRNKKK